MAGWREGSGRRSAPAHDRHGGSRVRSVGGASWPKRASMQGREDYRALVEQVPAVLYIDTPGQSEHTVYASPHVEQMLGITQGQFVGDEAAWIAMLHPEDRDRVLREYDEFLRGGPDVGDYRMVRPDGRVVWIRDRGKIVRDDAGRVLVERGVMFDVTELKEAEEVITRQVDLLKKVDMIGRDFTDIVLRGGGLRQILRSLADIAGNPVVLEDFAHHPVESAGPERALERALEGWQAHSRTAHDERERGVADRCDERGCVWIPIWLREELWGRLHLLEAERSIDEVDALALDRAAAAVAVSLLSLPDVSSVGEQAGSGLLLDILHGRSASSHEILRRARALGADLEGRALGCLAVVLRGVEHGAAHGNGGQHRDRRRQRAEALREVRAAVAAAGCSALAALDGARMLVIVGAPGARQPREVLAGLGRESARIVGERLGVGAAVGASQAVSVEALGRSLANALEAAAFGAGTGGGGVHFFEDLGVHHLLLAWSSEGPELARFVEQSLKPLFEHDAGAPAPLAPTLRAYLDHGGSKAVTARRLHIDRRTLYHRLERIEGLLHRSLDDQEARIELTLALRGLDVLRRRSEPVPGFGQTDPRGTSPGGGSLSRH